MNVKNWEEFDVDNCVGTDMIERPKKFFPAPALMFRTKPSQRPPDKET